MKTNLAKNDTLKCKALRLGGLGLSATGGCNNSGIMALRQGGGTVAAGSGIGVLPQPAALVLVFPSSVNCNLEFFLRISNRIPPKNFLLSTYSFQGRRKV